MDLKLEGKVALVTGGARDVGHAIALTLAAEGAAVAVNYRNAVDAARAVVEMIKTKGGRALACRADIANYDAVTAMVNEVVGTLGGLNILVNNAGLAVRRRFVETAPAEWQRQIDVCLYGAIHCCMPRHHISRPRETAALSASLAIPPALESPGLPLWPPPAPALLL